ncbi:hypothetical protein HID58_084514 [Brassica napus]|uniref:Uncharacterized protein n=1 Tax=Brassica napus TaxID=3708 RepID=A0ABQ7XJW5_BRANA|nr:hypothetical protein HID58_084514 [Brassica napus]
MLSQMKREIAAILVLTSGGPKIEHTGVRVSYGAKARYFLWSKVEGSGQGTFYGGRSQRQPPRTSVLDLKSANLGVTLLSLCLFRRLPEALSFEDMLSFILLFTVRFLSSVVSLCLCGASAPHLSLRRCGRCKEFKPPPAVHESRFFTACFSISRIGSTAASSSIFWFVQSGPLTE